MKKKPEYTNTHNTINKLSNGYADQIPSDIYEAIPKTVWAAIAVSFATCGGDRLEEAVGLILKEWDILNTNDIVPQAVPARFRKFIPEDEA